MEKLEKSLLFLVIVFFLSGCVGIGNSTMGTTGVGFYFGACIIGGLMSFVSIIRMLFTGFGDAALKFFIIGTVLFLIG